MSKPRKMNQTQREYLMERVRDVSMGKREALREARAEEWEATCEALVPLPERKTVVQLLKGGIIKPVSADRLTKVIRVKEEEGARTYITFIELFDGLVKYNDDYDAYVRVRTKLLAQKEGIMDDKYDVVYKQIRADAIALNDRVMLEDESVIALLEEFMAKEYKV